MAAEPPARQQAPTPARREDAAPAAPARAAPSLRERIRIGGALLLGVLLGVFAVVNLGKVKVDWIFGTLSTPLIIVIAISAVVGALLDRLVFRRLFRRGRRRARGTQGR